jgi:nitroreductase
MLRNVVKLFVLAGALLPSWGAGEVKSLPAPVMTGGMPLMEAIAKRHSARDYDTTRAIDDQTLADILWVAWGKGLHGKRTIPTSRGLQNMQLFVLTSTGTWEYDGMAHKLVKINDKNLIPLCERQDFVKNAPLHLLYTCLDDRGGENHVGSAYQNVYLYCTSRGLSTVIRAMIDKDALKAGIGLPENHLVVVHQCIGWPAPKK